MSCREIVYLFLPSFSALAFKKIARFLLLFRLLAIKDHIASSLMMEQDDFEYAPFKQFGGIGRASELFGEELTRIMEEPNARLAA